MDIEKFQSTGPLRDPTDLDLVEVSLLDRFQSTGPLRDPTLSFDFPSADRRISIHRSLAGPDCISPAMMRCSTYFNPQVPCGTRHQLAHCFIGVSEFQSTGPLRDPTNAITKVSEITAISIHRSLAGPDRSSHRGSRADGNFNPQVPCGTRLRDFAH